MVASSYIAEMAWICLNELESDLEVFEEKTNHCAYIITIDLEKFIKP